MRIAPYAAAHSAATGRNPATRRVVYRLRPIKGHGMIWHFEKTAAPTKARASEIIPSLLCGIKLTSQNFRRITSGQDFKWRV